MTKVQCTKNAMQEHLNQKHSGRNFEEFQCLYCETGCKSVEEIRQHMSEYHPSNFLFVGARWNCNTAKNDTDQIQILYIGDSKDYSSYNLYTCSNFDALNSMDPRELSPSKQLQKLNAIRYENIKAKYCGRLPSISYTFTKKFFNEEVIHLERYWELRSSQAMNTSSLASSSKTSAAEQRNTAQFKASTSSNSRFQTLPKHHYNQSSHRANQSINSTRSVNSNHLARPNVPMASTSKPPTASIPSSPSAVEYICIYVKLYEDLITINESEHPTRQCYICDWIKKINNNNDLYEYVEHFIKKHSCQKACQVKMLSIEDIQEHRIKWHKRDPLVCLKIKKSNRMLYELFKFRYECQECEQRFDTHAAFDLHFLTKHRDLHQMFESQKLVAESTVVRID